MLRLYVHTCVYVHTYMRVYNDSRKAQHSSHSVMEPGCNVALGLVNLVAKSCSMS